MSYKNSHNCEDQSVLFSYTGEPGSTEPILPAELEGAAVAAGSVSIE